MSARDLADTVRLGLYDGCAYACGCDHPGDITKCIHVERFAALDALEAKLNEQEQALRALYDSALIVANGVDPAHLDPGIEIARRALGGNTTEPSA